MVLDKVLVIFKEILEKGRTRWREAEAAGRGQGARWWGWRPCVSWPVKNRQSSGTEAR